MDFDNNHYTRDWRFLSEIATEWARLAAQFGFGSKEPLQNIEEQWNAIFNVDKDLWPAIRRLHEVLMRDEALIRHLRKCFWRVLKPEERKSFQLDGKRWQDPTRPSVLARTLKRLVWQVVKSADAYLAFQGNLEHWARFWTTHNLTEELRRAIKDLDESREIINQPPKGAERQRNFEEFKKDQQNKHSESPEELLEGKEKMLRFCHSQSEKDLIGDWLDNVREGPAEREGAAEEAVARRNGVTAKELNALLRRIAEAELLEIKQRILGHCESRKDKELFDDWFDNARDAPEREKEVLDRHGVSAKQFNAALRRIAQRIKDDNAQKGARS